MFALKPSKDCDLFVAWAMPKALHCLHPTLRAIWKYEPSVMDHELHIQFEGRDGKLKLCSMSHPKYEFMKHDHKARPKIYDHIFFT